MGLVINPTAFRIGHVLTWTDAWYLHRMHYSVFVHKSLEIKTLLQYILLNRYPSKLSHWVYSHITYYFKNNKFFINLFVYDGNDPHGYFMLAKEHKYGWFRKVRLGRFWTKKQLLDLQFFYQRWFLLCQAMNFDLEKLELDSLKWRVKERELRKISNLRKKYGRSWVAREELFIWKFPISMASKGSYNKMGVKMLNLLYKLFILPKIKKVFCSKDFNLIYTANNVVKSYKKLYFFFSYIDRIFKIIPSYPVGLYNRWTHKTIYKFFRMYFVFKPYWINLSKLYELILVYINVNSKIKVYLLDNIHLNASYLARYIMTCLRLKFDYRDTMIPIKKTLLKIMFAKRWRPIRDFKKKNWEFFLERYKYLLKDRLKFHLITNDVVKMSLYRHKLLKRMKRMFRKVKYSRFSIFNFFSLKKNLVSLYNKSFNVDGYFLKNVILNIHLRSFSRFKFNGFYFLKNCRYNFFNKIIKFKHLKNKISNKISFFFFNKKKLKTNFIFKKDILSYINRLNNLLHIKRILFVKRKILFWDIQLLVLLKQILFSCMWISRLETINRLYSFTYRTSFSERFSRLNIKSWYWARKRRRLKQRLYALTKKNYKRQNRIKMESDFSLLKLRMGWPYMRGWFRKRKRLFRPLKGRFVKFRVAYKKSIPSAFLAFGLTKINFFYIPGLIEYFNSFDFELHYSICKNYFYRNNLYFYDKNYKRNYYNVFLRADIKRGFSNLFFFFFLFQYSFIYKPFTFNIDLYKKYIYNVLNLPDVDSQFIANKQKKKDLEEMPLKDKFKRLKILEGGTRSLLYGYKFHFVGRFTRKQKAASLWFAKGANSVSSMRVDVDYGFHTIALRYSACTLKVWLYRNRGYSFKYGYRLV